MAPGFYYLCKIMRFKRNISPGHFLLWAVAVLTALLYIFMPLSGDDYAYKVVWHYPDIFQAIIHYPGFIKEHWLGINGRMANFLAPPLLNLIPKWAFALLCGAATWLMLYMALRWSGLWRSSGFLSTLLIAVVILAFPWWDSMQLFDCQLNYIWASALVLTALWLVFHSTPKGNFWLVGAAVVAFLGGMMHESATLPLFCGIAVWGLIHRHDSFPKPRVIILICFIIGGLIALCSPGIWHRAMAESVPDDTLGLLFLKSFAIVSIFWLTFAIMAFSRRGRLIIKDIISSPLVICAVATIPSVIIGLKSGIVGRTGWFGNLYALIVMFFMWHRFINVRRQGLVPVASWLLAAIVVLQMGATVVCQSHRDNEHERFVELFLASKDGVVYIDSESDDELPWWTLGRTRGIPDPDDYYPIYTLALYRDWGKTVPVILPEDAHLAVLRGTGTTELQNGDIITDRLTEGAYPYEYQLLQREYYYFKHPNGEWWIAQRITSTPHPLYHLSPLILDPGDRLPPELRDN